MAIQFNFQKKARLIKRTSLKYFIVLMAGKEKKEVEDLIFIFCDNTYLLDINRSNLQHDYFTDIITFGSNDGRSKRIGGEIYISVDMVRSNAESYNTSYSNELLRVIFHGVLHLCGYKDKSKNDIKLMRSKEDYYLELYRKFQA